MNLRLHRTVQNLLILTVACTPLFALREFLKSSGVAVPAYALYFNLAKDLLLFLVSAICFLQIVHLKQYPSKILPYFLVFTGFIVLVSILSAYDPLMVMGGVRWSLPLLLIFLLVGYIDKAFMQRLNYAVIFVLIISTLTQVYQLITKQFHWGPSAYGGLLGRVSGFFELPSVASLFGCLAFFLIRYYFVGKAMVRKILMAVSILNVYLLSLSTTGFILMLLLLIVPLVYRPSKYRMVYAIAAVVMGIIVYLWIDQLNGRYPGDSNVSWNIRVGLMKGEWQQAQLISSHFGRSTNSAWVIKGAFKDQNTAHLAGGGEALYPPMLGNYGIVFFCLVVILLVGLTIWIVRKGNEPMFVFFLLAVLGALTVRVTECFPINLLIAIIAAYFIYHPFADSKKINATLLK